MSSNYALMARDWLRDCEHVQYDYRRDAAYTDRETSHTPNENTSNTSTKKKREKEEQRLEE